MRIIEKEGRGVIVLIRDTRSTVISDMLRGAEAPATDDEPRRLREFGVGAQILLDLGIEKMELLSNTPPKVVGLEGYGLSVVGHRPISSKSEG